MWPVPSFMESGRAATNYKTTDSVNPFDEVNGRVGEQGSPYQTDPGVISLHDPQPPFTASQSRNFTTQRIPSDASGSRIAGRSYPGTPDAGANAAWFAPRTAGQEAQRVLGYDPRFFHTLNANAEDTGQKFQEPPVTLKSLAPAAFPNRGTPVSCLWMDRVPVTQRVFSDAISMQKGVSKLANFGIGPCIRDTLHWSKTTLAHGSPCLL
jgi:hypothetical protein